MGYGSEGRFGAAIPDNGGKPIFHRQMRLFGIPLLTPAQAPYNRLRGSLGATMQWTGNRDWGACR
jgi:hypothetical protein